MALVEAATALGESWRQRWDSLQLFTPRAFSALPGLPFPPGATASPDRLEMADYLQAYATRFDLPVRLDVRVQHLVPADHGFRATTSAGTITARHVVVASGPFHDPMIPAAAAALHPSVQQLHSSAYRRPGDLLGADVVVVGGGNSAAQIALELRTSHDVTLVTPRPPWFVPAQILGVSSYRWMSWLGILDADVDGRIVRYVRRRGDAIFGRELAGPIARGELRLRTSRVVSARGSELGLADGTTLAAPVVVWCTGFHARYDWLTVPGALDAAGSPVHDRGASPIPGLHWMGLPWQRTLDSSIVHGVDADAQRCVDRIGSS